MKVNTYGMDENWVMKEYGDYIKEDGSIDFEKHDKATRRKSSLNAKGWIMCVTLLTGFILLVWSIVGGLCTPSTRYKTAEQKEVHQAYVQSEAEKYGTSEADFAEIYGYYKGWN